MPDRGIRMPRSARRRQLVDAASMAFLAGGYDGTSMEDVAQHAGVSRLIVYRIFESKEALYRAVLTSLLGELEAEYRAATEETLRAKGAAAVILPVARRHPGAFRLLWRQASHEPQFADLVVAFTTQVTRTVRQMMQPYVSDDVLLDWAARSAAAHLIEGICCWLEHGDPARDDDFVTIMTAGMRGLATAWVRQIAAPAGALPPPLPAG